MIMAILVLFVMLTLTTVAVAVSVQTSTSTTRDDDSKAALAAAEAGLQVAASRLSQLIPASNECINGKEHLTPVSEATSTIEATCTSGSESLGNGASFQYWVSLPLVIKGDCAGRQVTAIANGATLRCITAVGKISGLSTGTRLQTLVETTSGTPLFPVNGLVGLEKVSLVNNAEVKAPVATNGTLELANSSSAESARIGPSGKVECANKSSLGSATCSNKETYSLEPDAKRETSAFTLAAVPIGNSATSNEDSRITSNLDKSSGNVTFSTATRTLELANSATLVLSGSVYNFCNLTAANSSTIEVSPPAGSVTQIFIDSPNRTGSGCAAGSGKLALSNKSSFVNPSKSPYELQIYVYDGSGGTIAFANNTTFYGSLYAPSSKIQLPNNAEFVGAAAGKLVEVPNSGRFVGSGEASKVTSGGSGTYERKNWAQCSAGTRVSESC